MAELLLVDDESGILMGLAALLRLRGHRVLCAAGVAEARSLLAASAPDLLITDYKLADGDGLALIQQARASYPLLPVILMSGFVDQDLRARFAALLEARLLEKPVDMGDLAEAVRALLPGPAPVSMACGDPVRAAADAARALGAAEDACQRAALAAYAFQLADERVAIGVECEGHLLRVEGTWPREHAPSLDRARWILDLLGGDLQTFAGGARLGVRLDGRSGTEGDDLSSFRPRTREELARRARTGSGTCNAPGWLRLLCELAGEDGLVARRGAAGRLPPDVAALWS
jgi:DNA-binding response OmpR family regulator